MTHSPLTDQIILAAGSSSRQGAKIDTVLYHHQAGTNDDQVIETMRTGARDVSSNYTLSAEGRLTCTVDEDLRAHTSGSKSDGGRGAAWDRRSITIEIENESTNGWTISAASYAQLAELAVDLHRRYGIPLDRDRHIGHRELWTAHRASYPTACPGGLSIDHVLELARALNAGRPGPKPAPATRPAAGGTTPPTFPLPAGHYFGPRYPLSNTRSVSGYYSHREDLRRVQRRMIERGYTFPLHGPDGLYGDEFAANVRHFQADKGLVVDELVGRDTWNALWTAPVTR